MTQTSQKDYIENNKIYLLRVIEKPNMVKVGDTVRDVDTRNTETMTNAALHRSNKETSFKAQKSDGEYFRDKVLHKFLEDKGYKRELNDQGNKSEWFFDLTDKDFVILFEEFIGTKPTKAYNLRAGQRYLFNSIVRDYSNGYRFFNLDACVRVGKTILSLHLSKELDLFPVYIGKNLTSQESAINDNTEFNIVPNLCIVSLHGDSDNKPQNIIKKIQQANPKNKKLIFFIDEVDDASHTENSRCTIKPIIDYFKKCNLFDSFVTMSGTRSYRGLKVLNDITNEKISEISIYYNKLQQIQQEVVDRRFTSISVYNTPEEATLSSISDAMKSAKGRKSIAKTIMYVISTNNNYGIDIDNNFKHIFIKISCIGKYNANQLVKYANKQYSNYHFVNINGDMTSARDAEKYCKKIIESTDKPVVFITQGMATTSFSVNRIGTTVVLSDNELTSDDIQALHRSCTWVPNKKYANLVYITTTDSVELQFDDIFEEEIKTINRIERQKNYEELLNRNCITHFLYNEKNNSNVKVSITKENIKKMLDIKMKYMTKIGSIIQLMKDEDLISNNISLLKSTSAKSKSAKGNSIDVFGDSGKSDKTPNTGPKKISEKKKEKILRALISLMVLVPALSKIYNADMLNTNTNCIGLDKQLFNDYYNQFPLLRDRIDMILNNCKDTKVLNEYIEIISNI